MTHIELTSKQKVAIIGAIFEGFNLFSDSVQGIKVRKLPNVDVYKVTHDRFLGEYFFSFNDVDTMIDNLEKRSIDSDSTWFNKVKAVAIQIIK